MNQPNLRVAAARIKNWTAAILVDDDTQRHLAKMSYYHKERSARLWAYGSDLTHRKATSIHYDVSYEEMINLLLQEGAKHDGQRQRAEEPNVLRSDPQQDNREATQDSDATHQPSADESRKAEL